MGFVRNLAKGGLFGLGGLAASGALKDKKKQASTQPSLIAKDVTGVSTPSLISSHPSIY